MWGGILVNWSLDLIYWGTLNNLTARWRSWERCFDNEGMEFGKLGENFGRWEVEFDKKKGEDFGNWEEEYFW